MKKKKNYKTHSFFVKNEEHKNIFKFLGGVSKNIYNTTVFIHSIFYKYKEEIYKRALEKSTDKTSKDDFEDLVEDELKYFYEINILNTSKVKENHSKLYGKIIKFLDKKKLMLNNNNFKKIVEKFKKKYEDKITHSNIYEYEFIIDSIFKSMYLSKYLKLKFEMNNNIPFSIDNKELQESVKKNDCLFPKKIESIKDTIKKFGKLLSDKTVIKKFVYVRLKNDRDKNHEKILSDLISQSIDRTFDTLKSYYALKEKGLKPSFPKYKNQNDTYILCFTTDAFRLLNNNIQMSVGNYISKNYCEIVKNNNNINICGTKYCKRSDLKDIKMLRFGVRKIKYKAEKISKADNFIVENNKYINKKSNKIFDSRFIEFKLPDKLKDKQLNMITISYLCEGDYMKMNISYDPYSSSNINKCELRKIKKDEIDSDSDIDDEPTNKYIKWKKNDQKLDILPKNCVSIDLGMKNLMTIYDPNGYQHIINGRPLLSINNLHKEINSSLQSKRDKTNDQAKKDEYKKLLHKYELDRINKGDEYLNKVVKFLFNIYGNKEKIIIGYNENWKSGIDLGKKTNERFYKIPFKRLINKLGDKFGSKLILTEESYTSKCDSLAMESLGHKEVYQGTRLRRGLYKSSTGQLINADLNGAINIMRKVLNMRKVDGLGIFNPLSLQILTSNRVCYNTCEFLLNKGKLQLSTSVKYKYRPDNKGSLGPAKTTIN